MHLHMGLFFIIFHLAMFVRSEMKIKQWGRKGDISIVKP